MIRTRRVGGIRFIWVGRLVVSYCISRKQRRPSHRAVATEISAAIADLLA